MESDKQQRASPVNRFTLGEESIDIFETNSDGGTMLTNTIVPPGPERDRTGPERERYKDRLRQKLKGKASDVISKIPIITKPGVIKVPVDGGYEPSWIPGRDGQGGGDGEGGEPGNEKGDFVEMPFEEFVEWIFGELDLPNMLKKQLATTLVKSQKVKGISKHGPEARLNKWQHRSSASNELPACATPSPSGSSPTSQRSARACSMSTSFTSPPQMTSGKSFQTAFWT